MYYKVAGLGHRITCIKNPYKFVTCSHTNNMNIDKMTYMKTY